jgi:hypothetical protein
MHAKTFSRYLPAFIVVAGAWAIALFFYLSTGMAGVLEGRLGDTDDYMRLLQVGRWLDGAGWYDTTMPRLNPPLGVELHWSRLADLPLAAAIALIEPWSGRVGAMFAAALGVPAVMLLGFLALGVWMARPSLPMAAVPLVPLIAIFSPALTGHFLPGRVDHHGWQLLIVAFVIGAFSRLVACPGKPNRLPEAVGVAFAFGLWIGGEIVPWLAAFNAVLAALWIADGRGAARLGLRVSAALALSSLGLLTLARLPARWLEVSCDSFSILHVTLAVASLAFWLLLDRGRSFQGTRGARAMFAMVAGVAAGALLLALFPECRSGPYAAVPAQLAETWLKNVSEARPLWVAFSRNLFYLPLFLGGVLLAAASAAYAAWRGQGRARRLWLMHLWLLLAALALAFWQLRTISFAILFALVPLTRLAWQAASFRALVQPHPLRKAAARFGSILLCGPVALLILPLVADLGESGSLGDVASDKPIEKGCDLRQAVPMLNDPHGLGARPRVIAAFIDMGPEILFRTPHAVLAAPYHRNTGGILDSYAFFDAKTPEAARELADKRGIDTVLFCTTIWEMGVHRAASGPGGFISALAVGDAPDWLRPVLLPPGSRLRLYVRRS